MTTATRPALIDPVVGENVWAHSGAGRYPRPAPDEYEAKSIRDKNGNDITPDDKHWYYRREPGDDNLDPGVSVHLSRLGASFFSYEHEGVGYDPETSTFVIDMDHKFSA